VPLLDLPPFVVAAADVSSGIRIESARPQDVARLLELIRALAEYEQLSHLVVGTAEELQAELFGERPVIEAVLAWESGLALGFALFFHNYSTFLTRRGLYLEDLFVVPEARGRGIGKALIRHGARLAVERGCGRYEWSVLDWNSPAIAFYESLGASVLSDWRICRIEGDALTRLAAPATP
jgi:GNAT superfamily N-acetyltransferase